MNKLISVIIPTFNSRTHLKNCLNSVLSQTYQNFEIIIVDDCSSDNTVKIIKNFIKKDSRIKLFKTKKNSGTVSVPRNLGVKKARGKLISFLDSDDQWEKNKLQSQVKVYNNKKTIYTTAASYFSEQSLKSNFLINIIRIFLQKFFIKKINNHGFQWLYIYNPIIVSSILAHKSLFENYSFDEDVNTREDIDMWIRLRKNNYKFYFDKAASTIIFRRRDSLSSNKKKDLVTLIRSLSNIFFKINTFSKLNYFLIGIILKFILAFIKINKKIIISLLKKTSVTLLVIYFVVFYTPLFWFLGKPLLHYDGPEKLDNPKNIVLFSGHGDTSYYNMTYQYRYKDIINITSEKDKTENIFILGRLQEIPEQRIIRKLLIADGYDESKIQIIYEEFSNTSKNIDNISKILKDKNINEIIFITSPYHTKRAKLLWSKKTDINVKILKSFNWPSKNNFFEYSKNKKIIIYEYVSIIYNRLIGNI